MKIVLSNRLIVAGIPDDMVRDLTVRLQIANPKWIDNHRMGRWNKGTPKTLKFFRRLKNGRLSLPRGYIRQVLLMARQRHIDWEIEDRRRRIDRPTLKFKGTLKPYQQEAVHRMARKEFGTLCAPTGSGKTVMALALVAKRQQSALIVVHTRELANQWMDRIETFLGISKADIGMIGAGKCTVGRTITIALVQSLYKRAKTVSRQIGHLIVDECHRTPSRTFTEAVNAFDAYYMLGLSATPWRRDKLSKLIFWHLGNLQHEVNKADLVAKGHILDIDVVWRETDFKPYYDPVDEYSRMLSELTADDARNRLICRDIAVHCQQQSFAGTTLVLSDRKKHCENLRAILQHKHGIAATVLTGDLPAMQRQAIVRDLSAGRIKVLIATGQLVGEGFDHSGLSTLFLTTPIRFSGRLLQYLGRILRPMDGIERAKVYDYIDLHVAPLVTAAQARMRVYGEGKTSTG